MTFKMENANIENSAGNLFKKKATLNNLEFHGTQSIIYHKTKKLALENRLSRLFSAIGLAISLSLVLLAFEWKSYGEQELVNLGQLETQFEELQDIPLSIQPAPPPPEKAIAPTIIEIPDDVDIEEKIELSLDVEVTEEMVIEQLVLGQKPEEEVSDEIFEIVEESASPINGIENFYRYFAKSVIYPIKAKKAGVQGKVYLSFVVNKEGEVSQVKVFKGLGFGCDEEAMRVVKEGPKWNPAKQRGHPVNSRVTLPLIFKLF